MGTTWGSILVCHVQCRTLARVQAWSRIILVAKVALASNSPLALPSHVSHIDLTPGSRICVVDPQAGPVKLNHPACGSLQPSPATPGETTHNERRGAEIQAACVGKQVRDLQT